MGSSAAPCKKTAGVASLSAGAWSPDCSTAARALEEFGRLAQSPGWAYDIIDAQLLKCIAHFVHIYLEREMC